MILTWRQPAPPLQLQWRGLDSETRAALPPAPPIQLAAVVGSRGDKGDKGDKGDQGDTGKSAYEQWLDLGNVGTFDDYVVATGGVTAAQLAAETQARSDAILAEAQARTDAIANQAQDFIGRIATEAQARIDALAAEAEARQAGDDALAQQLAAINLDWSAIDNKPVFSPVATSGEFSDLKDVPVFARADAANAFTGTFSLLNPEPAMAAATAQNAPAIVFSGQVFDGTNSLTRTGTLSYTSSQAGTIKLTFMASRVSDGSARELFSVESSDSGSGYNTFLRMTPAGNPSWGGYIAVNYQGQFQFLDSSKALSVMSGAAFGQGHPSGYTSYWVNGNSAEIRSFFNTDVLIEAGRPAWKYGTTAGNSGNETLRSRMRFVVENPTSANVAVTVKGAASQTANLTEWRSSANLLLGFVSAAGLLSCAGLAVTGNSDVSGYIAPLGPVKFSAKTVAQLTAISGASDGDTYRVTNGTRPNRLVYRDGAAWRYVSDDTVVS